ncbi:MAG: hypothetical protein AAGJ83_13135, partial [Planctomycetota bacterium]
MRVFVVCCALLPPSTRSFGRDQVGELESAAAQLIAQVETGNQDLSVECVALARRAKTALPPETLHRLYEAALHSQGQADHQTMDVGALIASLSVANHFSQSGQNETFFRSLRQAHSITRSLRARRDASAREISGDRDEADVAERAVKNLMQLTMRSAWDCLTQARAGEAEQLYELAMESLRGSDSDGGRDASSDLALALLGKGWALSMQPSKQRKAGETLQAFGKQFPQHADFPRASALSIRCFLNAEDDAEAVSVFQTMTRHSPLAKETRDTAE